MKIPDDLMYYLNTGLGQSLVRKFSTLTQKSNIFTERVDQSLLQEISMMSHESIIYIK